MQQLIQITLVLLSPNLSHFGDNHIGSKEKENNANKVKTKMEWLENFSFNHGLIELMLDMLFMFLMKFKLGKTALVYHIGIILNNKRDLFTLGNN